MMSTTPLERQLQVRLPVELDDAIRSAAEAVGLDRAAYVRGTLARALNRPLREAWPVLKSKLKAGRPSKLDALPSVGLDVEHASSTWMMAAVYARSDDGKRFEGPLLDTATLVHSWLGERDDYALVTRDQQAWDVVGLHVLTTPDGRLELRIELQKQLAAKRRKKT